MFNSNWSEYDQMELGSSPNGEECVQVSQKVEYIDAMRTEVRRYREMLQKRFPDFEKYDCTFKIQSNPHDFGTYYEVAIKYNTMDENSEEFALFVESNCPEKWDDETVLHWTPEPKEQEQQCPSCHSGDIAPNDGQYQCQKCGCNFAEPYIVKEEDHV